MPLCPQITITPITVTSTGMTTTSIIPIVAATTEETDELQVEIDDITLSLNGKNHMYRQATAPDGSVYPLVEGDVWFDTDDGNKQYYWTGSAWVSVQDLGIAAAEAGAAAAEAAAAAAQSAAAGAAAAAAAAQTTADGKNRVYRQTTQPTGGTYVEGDLWFDTDDDNKIYRFTSGSWGTAVTLGDNALASISANKITAGTIDASVITVSNINAGNIATGNLSADRILTNSLSGDKITTNTLDASKIVALSITAAKIASSTITATNIAGRTITADRIALFTLTADEIAGSTITAAEIAANTITADEIAAGSITVDRLTAGTLTAFTLQTSSGSRRVRIDATNNAISFREAGTIVGWVGPASVSGVLMHYGSTFNANATSYPLAYVSSGSVVIAQSSGRFLEVSTVGCVANGDFYSLDATYIQDPSTTANASNARIDVGNGRLRRSTASSARFKEAIADVSTVADLAPSKLLALPVRAFKFKADYLDAADNRAGMTVPGLIAEEVAEHYAIAADKGEDGLIENWNERFIIPGMLALIQDLHARVQTLEGGTNG